MVLKTVCVESSQSMRGELERKLGRGEEVRSESEMREDWRWNVDGKERQRLNYPICRLIVC